jgi:hypothetical protein
MSDREERLRRKNYFYRVKLRGGGEFIFNLDRALNRDNLLTVALEIAQQDVREWDGDPADIADISKATCDDYLGGR